MNSTTIDVPTQDGKAEAFLVRPDGDGPHAGVLMYMDAIGLRPRIREMAERIAEWGYIVLVPNVFYRDTSVADFAPQADLLEAGAREAHMARAMKLLGAHDARRAQRDAGAYVKALRGMEGVAAGDLGTIGYCMGGALALRTAAQHPADVGAAGTFHAGRIATDKPDSVHRLVGRIDGEVYAAHADKDKSMPPKAISQLEKALRQAYVPFTSEVYRGAAHGFTMADTPAYDEAATERHFKALQSLFGRTLR
ncbi:dienelactone hydrolase family protein [Paraconexibacter sp. AEG42_29]